MPRIIWSTPSLHDLRDIDAFLSTEDPRAAVRILRAIRAKTDQLRDYPSSGPALDDERRYLGVRGTPYVLVYRFDGTQIQIARVRHARADWRGE